MDMIYEIRRRYLVQKQTITDIAKDMGLSRPTVRKHILTVDEPKYQRDQTAAPKFDPFKAQLTQWLAEDAKLTRARRRSGQRLFEGLQTIGYSGAYDSLQRFVRATMVQSGDRPMLTTHTLRNWLPDMPWAVVFGPHLCAHVWKRKATQHAGVSRRRNWCRNGIDTTHPAHGRHP